MKKLAVLIGCVIVLAAAASAQPSIKLIQNNYGWQLPGLPSYGIAQGSIFTITGTNLGPASIQTAGISATNPLPTTGLGGTTASVTVGGQTVQVPLYYSLGGAVSGVLPSNTPVGDGTLTITYNGQSQTQPIHVVARAFGILSLNGGGSGTAVAQDFTTSSTNPPLVGYNQPAHTGDTLVIYGTGLGASTNDTALNNTINNLTSTAPVSVWVGGQQVTPDYAGRSAYYPGLDQINFKVPASVSGCNVSLWVQTGTGASAVVSNTVTLPIANGAATTCSDTTGLSTADIGAMASGNFRLGTVSLSRTSFDLGISIPGFPSTFTTDVGAADFTKVATSGGVVAQNPFQFASIGSCIVIPQQTTSNPTVNVQGTGLDAGPQIGLTGPKGAATLTPTAGQKGIYSATLSGSFTSPTPYLDPGAYTVTGPGGADVSGFTLNMNVPAALTWTNAAATTTVTRSSGVTVNWTGGDPASQTEIYGMSSAGDNGPNVIFICTAPTSAGTFTVPAGVLMQLPATPASSGGIPTGFLGVGSSTMTRAATTPTGLDALYATSSSLSGKTVTYQ